MAVITVLREDWPDFAFEELNLFFGRLSRANHRRRDEECRQQADQFFAVLTHSYFVAELDVIQNPLIRKTVDRTPDQPQRRQCAIFEVWSLEILWCLELFNGFPFDTVAKVVSLLALIGLIPGTLGY